MKTEINLSTDFVEMVASGALDGCVYWADSCEFIGTPKGEYASEHLANGGAIKIHDSIENKWHTVTCKKFCFAIGKYIQMLYVDESISGYLDDATAETVLQLACFDDVIYG